MASIAPIVAAPQDQDKSMQPQQQQQQPPQQPSDVGAAPPRQVQRNSLTNGNGNGRTASSASSAPLQTSTPPPSPPAERRTSLFNRLLGNGSKRNSRKSSLELVRTVVLERVNGDLGLTVDRGERGRVTVSKVMPGSTASLQHVNVGDEVTAINNKPAGAISMEELVRELAQPSVALTLNRLTFDEASAAAAASALAASASTTANTTAAFLQGEEEADFTGLNTSSLSKVSAVSKAISLPDPHSRGLRSGTGSGTLSQSLSHPTGSGVSILSSASFSSASRRQVTLRRRSSQSFGIEFESQDAQALKRSSFVLKRQSSKLLGVTVIRVLDGPATNLVFPGDQILELNGKPVEAFSQSKLLKEFRAHTEVTLTLGNAGAGAGTGAGTLPASSGHDSSVLLGSSLMEESNTGAATLPTLSSSSSAAAAAAANGGPAAGPNGTRTAWSGEVGEAQPLPRSTANGTSTPNSVRAKVWSIPSAVTEHRAQTEQPQSQQPPHGQSPPQPQEATTTTTTTTATVAAIAGENGNSGNAPAPAAGAAAGGNAAAQRLIRLVKGPAGFGMKLRTDSRANGAIVAALSARGVALQNDVRLGDRLVRINGVDVTRATHEEIVEMLHANSQVVLLVEPSGLLEDADYIRSVCLTSTERGNFGFAFAVAPEAMPSHLADGSHHHHRGDSSCPEQMNEAPVIRLTELTPDGPAARNGHVYVGDCVLEVDGCPLLPGSAERLAELMHGKTELSLVLARQLPVRHDEELDMSLSELESSQLAAEQALVKRASALGINLVTPDVAAQKAAQAAANSLAAGEGQAGAANAANAANTNAAAAAAQDAEPAVTVDANGVQQVRVTFEVGEYRCEFGQRLAVVGSLPALGHWDPKHALPMTWSAGDKWSVSVLLPLLAHFEYKYLVLDRHGVCVRWEDGKNARFGGYGGPVTLPRLWGTVEGHTQHLFSLLCVAADGGQVDRCVELIRQGAPVNGCTRWGTFTRLSHATPLHIAVIRKQEAVIEALLAHGADPELRTSLTRLVSEGVREQVDVATALHLAVFEGATHIVQVLVDNGASRSAECFVAQNGAYLSPSAWVTALQLASLRPHNRALISNLLLSSRI